MIRFKIDSESTDILDRLVAIYNFKKETIVIRLAIAISIEKGDRFSLQDTSVPSNGREFTPTSNVFGRLVNDVDNYIIYLAVFEQHYQKKLSESEFIFLLKCHLKNGLNQWIAQVKECDITKGEHINILLTPLQRGLSLKTNTINLSSSKDKIDFKEYKKLVSFDLGVTEDNEPVTIRLNDLKEFDNRNIAIAGMAGSGKTQLIKDILYQISHNTDQEVKFIFFDYKGEGNPNELQSFLKLTNCEFIDILAQGGLKFNPLTSINLEERQRPFSIHAFVDTIATFTPKMGVKQKNVLISAINNCLDKSKGEYPSVLELFESVEEYYEENKLPQDTLYSIIRDLSTNLFDCSSDSQDILSKSMYLNLPPALSDTLRQLIVFLLLRYFSTFFSSTNDCVPENDIFPVRYVIVIDEAHIYLKNKNARKALEELLRLLRSKGVVIVMLSQGVEDYKTADFDFASQVKLPICLNIQNKDYKGISNFVGTPSSQYKLESEIKKLTSGKGLINIKEPKVIEIRQWFRTFEKL